MHSKTKPAPTETGRNAREMIATGLEVNAEIALEEPQGPKGLDNTLRKLVQKHGLVEVLASFQCAAWGAAEMHEDSDDLEDVTASFRLHVFGRRLQAAMDALK